MEFLSLDDVLALHDRLIEDTGGKRGILHRSTVASALERCRWGPFRHGATLTERAALLLRGVVQDHPFVDGNKRTAFSSAETFLERNGLAIHADADAIVGFMLDAAQGLGLAAINRWLAQHHERLSGGIGQ